MRLLSRPKVRLWWERASWVIPLLGVLGGLILYSAVSQVDEAAYSLGDIVGFSADASITILAAIGGGMITFTGFVFSFIVLLLQFGSTAYSPRSVAYLLRARAVQWILGLFLSTVTFSFLTLIDTGSGNREDFVPAIAVVVAVFLMLASLVGFVALLHVVGRRVRVDAVLSSIGASSQRALRRSASFVPRNATTTSMGREATQALRSTDARSGDEDGVQIVHYVGENGQIVAINVKRLLRLVRRRGGHVEIVLRVGDAVTVGTPVARVSGPQRPTERQISATIIVDSERSLIYDPLYALRLLVDVAIRALSPAVNDPTTAVRALDEIEAVLRTAADQRMGAIRFDLDPGELLLSRPAWDEVVDLALIEIVLSGARDVQVHRRMLALVEDLIPAVSPDRRTILLEYRDHLLTNADQMPGRAGRIAVRGDRQGLGGSS